MANTARPFGENKHALRGLETGTLQTLTILYWSGVNKGNLTTNAIHDKYSPQSRRRLLSPDRLPKFLTCLLFPFLWLTSKTRLFFKHIGVPAPNALQRNPFQYPMKRVQSDRSHKSCYVRQILTEKGQVSHCRFQG